LYKEIHQGTIPVVQVIDINIRPSIQIIISGNHRKLASSAVNITTVCIRFAVVMKIVLLIDNVIISIIATCVILVYIIVTVGVNCLAFNVSSNVEYRNLATSHLATNLCNYGDSTRRE